MPCSPLRSPAVSPVLAIALVGLTLVLSSCGATSAPTQSTPTTPTLDPVGGTGDCPAPCDTGNRDTGPDDSGEGDDTGGGETGETGGPADSDGDGYFEGEDCDDTDSTIFPGATEVCGDGRVNNCDGDAATAEAACDEILDPTDATATWSFGHSRNNSVRVVGAGDLDGDGSDDIVVGHPNKPLGADPAMGAVTFYSGPFSGTLDFLDAGEVIMGSEAWDQIGWDILPAGDLDEDGYADLVVGASNAPDNALRDTGAVYLFHGPVTTGYVGADSLLVSEPNEIECLGSSLHMLPPNAGGTAEMLVVGGQCGNVVRLFSLSQTLPHMPGTTDSATLIGVVGEEDGRFGHHARSGDTNGDGLTDLAVSAPTTGLITGSSNTGAVFLFDGPLESARSAEDAFATIRAVATDSDTGHTRLGSGTEVGDLNQDGYADLLTGGCYFDDPVAPARWEGIALAYMGPFSGALGLDDADVSIVGDANNDRLGGEMVLDDVDVDGQPDWLLGQGYVEVTGSTSSIAYSYTNRAWLLLGPIPTGHHSIADIADIMIEDTDTEHFGQQVSVAGDTNGDGQKEILVGSWYDTFHLFDLPTIGI
jgi:hypothetical protein